MNAEVEAIDSLSLTMGRLVLFVKAPEVEGVSTALAISQFSTQVQLNLSAQGYVFTGQDIPTPTFLLLMMQEQLLERSTQESMLS